MARRAGMRQAARAVPDRMTATAMSVSGSAGCTPKSIVRKVLISQHAGSQPDGQANQRLSEAFPHHQLHDIWRACAERHPHADLRRAQRDQVAITP